MGTHCLLQQRDKPCWTVWSLEKSRRRCHDERQGGAVGVPTAPPLIMVSLFALHPDAFMGLMWVKGGVQDISAELERCRGPARTLSLLQVPLQMQEEALGARGHPRDFPLRSQSSSHPPLPAPAQSIHQAALQHRGTLLLHFPPSWGSSGAPSRGVGTEQSW